MMVTEGYLGKAMDPSNGGRARKVVVKCCCIELAAQRPGNQRY